MRRHFHHLIAFALLFGLLIACSKPKASEPSKPARSGRPATPAGAHDLSVDEARGGHTLKKHVGRSDNDLRERLRRESNISTASTYTDRRTAEDFIAECLQENQGRVMQWSSGQRHPNLALDCVGDPAWPIGRSLRRGASQVEPCSNATLVLKFDPPEGYYVLTSYPDCR